MPKKATSTKPQTSGYKSLPHIWFHQPRDLPPFTFATIRQMLIDPGVRLNLSMRAAPVYGVEFAYKTGDEWTPGVQAARPEVGAFVYRQLQLIWRNYLSDILQAQVWGWSAGEVTLKRGLHNRVEICELLARHSADCRMLKASGMQHGVRINRVEGKGTVDLEFPCAWFHNHGLRDGEEYGTSILLGAYSPWADKWLNGGALDVRRVFMHKDAYGGADLSFPEGDTLIEGQSEPVPNGDIARQIVEQLQSGGVTTRPSERDADGNEKWQLTRTSVPSSPTHILDYPKDLDAEIRRGMETPDDVISGDSTGAWAGKRIPMAAFMASLDAWVVAILRDIVSQVIEPLVALNFGEQWFEVTHKPLGEQAMEQQSNAGPRDGDGDGIAGEGTAFARMALGQVAPIVRAAEQVIAPDA